MIPDVDNYGNPGMLTAMYENNLTLYYLIYFLSIFPPYLNVSVNIYVYIYIYPKYIYN